MRGNAAVNSFDEDFARRRYTLALTEDGVDAKFGFLPVWDPSKEALRLRINTREQTVTADTVAHDYGDDVDAYNRKVAEQAYSGYRGDGDRDEYRVMVWDSDVEWVSRVYNAGKTRADIADMIIAAKISAESNYSVFDDDAAFKHGYAARMVKHHRDAIEALFCADCV